MIKLHSIPVLIRIVPQVHAFSELDYTPSRFDYEQSWNAIHTSALATVNMLSGDWHEHAHLSQMDATTIIKVAFIRWTLQR